MFGKGAAGKWGHQMKYATTVTCAVAVSATFGASAALAGGFERAGQSVNFMFEKGSYAELSFSYVMPDLRRNPDVFGDVAGDYFSVGAAFKKDLSDKLSLGISVDQPYGANVSYLPVATIEANLSSTSINALARYKLTPAFSVHGGLSYVTMGGDLRLPAIAGGTPILFDSDSDVAYSLGAAFEKPEIALRVAVTYFSGTNHSLTANLPIAPNTINPPQAVNLDFQTGVAKDTLVFGQVRWADWSGTSIVVAGADIVTYDNDVFTYTLGVGRKFNENWSGALTVGYERAQGGIASALSPSDGYLSLGLGGSYTKDNMKISGGLRYVAVGDAVASTGSFENNSALGVGIKVGWTF